MVEIDNVLHIGLYSGVKNFVSNGGFFTRVKHSLLLAFAYNHQEQANTLTPVAVGNPREL